MDLQRPRLLVVDDDQTILTLIDRIGVAEGFDVDTTADSSDALVHLFKRPADLVLLDVRMPGMSRAGRAAVDSRHELAPQGGADVGLRRRSTAPWKP